MIGGVKELTGEEYGVYVKRILPGGLASNDGKFSPKTNNRIFCHISTLFFMICFDYFRQLLPINNAV